MSKVRSKGKTARSTITPKFWEKGTLSNFSHLGVEVKLKSQKDSALRGQKTIHNVSLQSYPIPTKNGSIKLSPGSSVDIPLSLITKRLLNLQKRRLITIR